MIKKSILLVDDDYRLRELLKDYLNEKNFQVFTSEDFDEAGSYKLLGKVVISDGTFYTDIHTFKVHRNL